jgi:hypothetical protein
MMARDLKMKLAVAATVLAAMVTAVLVSAQLGVLQVGAGDMNIIMAKGDAGFTMDIMSRTCPPNCAFDIDWRPLVR